MTRPNFGISLYLHPYFVHASSEGSGEIAHMARLVRSFADALSTEISCSYGVHRVAQNNRLVKYIFLCILIMSPNGRKTRRVITIFFLFESVF